MASGLTPELPRTARRFATTRWSLVLQTRHRDPVPARAAIAELCEAYWQPVYAFVRRSNRNRDDAQELTQAFFVRILEHDVFEAASPARGRFRTFLLTSLRNFLANEHDRATAIVRGGRVVVHSLDPDILETVLEQQAANQRTPEQIFERQWALAVLERVLQRVRDEHVQSGRGEVFEILNGFLTADSADQSYAEAAEQLAMTPDTVRVAVHRLRKRYRVLLRAEVADTTASPAEVDDELRLLLQALR